MYPCSFSIPQLDGNLTLPCDQHQTDSCQSDDISSQSDPPNPLHNNPPLSTQTDHTDPTSYNSLLNNPPFSITQTDPPDLTTTPLHNDPPLTSTQSDPPNSAQDSPQLQSPHLHNIPRLSSTQTDPPDSSTHSPQLHSTPLHNNPPHNNPPLNTSTDLPGLLDLSTVSHPSSLSLQDLSDLDQFLPFATYDPTIPDTTPSLSLTEHVAHPDQDWSDLDQFLPFATYDPTIPDIIPSLSQTVCTAHPDQDQHTARVHVQSTVPPENVTAQDTQQSYSIPTIIGNTPRHTRQNNQPRPPCLTTIKRDNRAITALSLPNIMVTNHRSIFPKFNNLVDEIHECEMHLGLHCEIWENKENKAHANKIEEALEIHGIQYISTPRPDRRGGGAAITLIKDSPFVLSKLNVCVLSGHDSLEVCWGLLKPKTPTGHVKSIIVCSFYIPPKSKKKSALIQHISLNYFILKSQYPDSAFVCGGDKNDLNTQLLLDIHPSFRQIVTKPTYKKSVLDVLVTDIGHYYLEPIIRPPVQPDNPAGACPSDHSIVFAKANVSPDQPVQREARYHTIRPLPDLALANFASWIQHESWEFVYNGTDTSDMVDRFNFLIQLNLDTHCPTQTVKSTNLDGKISSVAVKQASRRKNREYLKHGNSAKYKNLKKEVKRKLSEATTDFLSKQTEKVCAKSNTWLRHVKRIASRPGDQPPSTFSLPLHVENNLSALESSNKICEYFSSISQEYTPLNIESLPEHVKAKVTNDPCDHPYLADHMVYDGLKKGKKTCSVPGDIPIKVLTEFLPELTAPVAAIYREAIATHKWPKSYKKEYHLPINKIPTPQSEDDLRNLGLTPFLSKRLEWFLIQWIWPYISPHIDLDQLGGLPGCSVEHYLVLMLDFIQKNLDKNQTDPTAVLAGLVDFSKAFNRIDHNVIVTILSDLNIPTCALRLIISYLSCRKMCVRYNGAVSAEQDIPGGGPQGGLLTVLLFDLQVNQAGAPCTLPRTLPYGEEGPELQRPAHAYQHLHDTPTQTGEVHTHHAPLLLPPHDAPVVEGPALEPPATAYQHLHDIPTQPGEVHPHHDPLLLSPQHSPLLSQQDSPCVEGHQLETPAHAYQLLNDTPTQAGGPELMSPTHGYQHLHDTPTQPGEVHDPLLLPPLAAPAPLYNFPPPLCHQSDKILKKKYVDDLTLLESINLKSCLIPSTPIIGPPNLHEQPGLQLQTDQSVLKHQLSDLLKFTNKNKMKINFKKTKILPFNLSKKFDFLPQLGFPNCEPLEVIYETKLLGVTLSSDLSWTAHVNEITKRATNKLWVLIRFKTLGGSQDQLLTVYQTRVRSTLEFAAPVFHSGLTANQSSQIEMVQKKALAIILGRQYSSYETALNTLNLERLDTRREDLSFRFALKCTKSHRHNSMFPPNPNYRPNMRNPKPFLEYQCHTSRYFNSAIPALSRLLNCRSRHAKTEKNK